MGHYDSCYEAEYEEIRKDREERRKQRVKAIQKKLEEVGLSETLVWMEETR